MANRIMTGKQILKAVTEEKLGSLGEFWDRRDELISSDRITSAQMENGRILKRVPHIFGSKSMSNMSVKERSAP